MRLPRLKVPNDPSSPAHSTSTAVYHCLSRVVDRRFILHDTEKDHFLALLRECEAFCRVRVLTFAILSNHFHILVEVPPRPSPDALPGPDIILQDLRRLSGHQFPEAVAQRFDELRAAGDHAGLATYLASFHARMWDLSAFMKLLKQRFSQWYNARNDRKGTLWEERFRSVLVEGVGQPLVTMAAYIDLNPVRAGLVDDPKDYRWSGYGEAMAGRKAARLGVQALVTALRRGQEETLTESMASYRQWLYLSGDERREEVNSGGGTRARGAEGRGGGGGVAGEGAVAGGGVCAVPGEVLQRRGGVRGTGMGGGPVPGAPQAVRGQARTRGAEVAGAGGDGPLWAALPRPEEGGFSDEVGPNPGSVDLTRLDLLPRIAWDTGLKGAWEPGEVGALSRLERFTAAAVLDYREQRDRPDRTGTSRISPHLHFGEIGPRQAWHAARRAAEHAGIPTTTWRTWQFLAEVGWREFAHHLLYHFPETPGRPLRPAFERFPWRTDPTLLTAWKQGRTGIPLVDAGMRELWATGWMHNRARMIVGSFLVKNLLLSWEEGARWFWDTLVDADLASNTLGWQWVGGCGADAAPYFRIFNPVSQGTKFDPDGTYVRRWVPELARVPAEHIHAPWEAPPLTLREAGVTLGLHYPHPIVSLNASRIAALAAFAHTKSASN
jgi:REP element-mobilizing transposase RayT